MTDQLVLLGGGGHASDVLAAIEGSGLDASVMIADDGDIEARRFAGRATSLVGTIADACLRDGRFLSAIGYPSTRRKVVAVADAAGVEWMAAIVHAESSVHPTVRLGADVVVMGQTWISAFVEVGTHTNIGYGVTIGHDTMLGSNVALMPGCSVGGDVVIDDGVLIGANATILQGLHLGAGSVVGAGAVVTQDVPPATTVIGIPAREKKS